MKEANRNSVVVIEQHFFQGIWKFENWLSKYSCSLSFFASYRILTSIFLVSASAFFVTQTLRCLSRDGRTVIASVHQPSSEVFELFDHLCLLSSGQNVYFGKASDAYEVRPRVSRSPRFFSTSSSIIKEALNDYLFCVVLCGSWIPLPLPEEPIRSFPSMREL